MLTRSTRGKRYHSSDTAEMGNFALCCRLVETLAGMKVHWLLLKSRGEEKRMWDCKTPHPRRSTHMCHLSSVFWDLKWFKLPLFMKTRCIAGELPVHHCNGCSSALPIPPPQERCLLRKTLLSSPWLNLLCLGHGHKCGDQVDPYRLLKLSALVKCAHNLLFLRPSLACGYFKGHF